MTASSDPLHGVGKYRVIRELGRGGMGEVFLAEHTTLGTRVVVKLLHAALAERANLADRLRLEAQALARLDHPNLVRVSDFDRTPAGRPYFVMEHLAGRSLRDELQARGGILPVNEAIDYVRQALAGLGAAHEAGLVHRDVKLDNLFVCEPQKKGGPISVKVLDFGVAKVIAGAEDGPAPLALPTGTGVVVGTPRFFAPEQARGRPLDCRADIYAMGLVLYTLVAGRGPFDDCSTILEMAKAHATRTPEPPSRLAPQPLPPALDAVVLRCLAKNPDDRFANAAAFAQALASIAAPSQQHHATTVMESRPGGTTDATTARLPERPAFAPPAALPAAPPPAYQPVPLPAPAPLPGLSSGVVAAIIAGAIALGAGAGLVALLLL